MCQMASLQTANNRYLLLHSLSMVLCWSVFMSYVSYIIPSCQLCTMRQAACHSILANHYHPDLWGRRAFLRRSLRLHRSSLFLACCFAAGISTIPSVEEEPSVYACDPRCEGGLRGAPSDTLTEPFRNDLGKGVSCRSSFDTSFYEDIN